MEIYVAVLNLLLRKKNPADRRNLVGFGDGFTKVRHTENNFYTFPFSLFMHWKEMATRHCCYLENPRDTWGHSNWLHLYIVKHMLKT